jgi:hypothetical protein
MGDETSHRIKSITEMKPSIFISCAACIGLAGCSFLAQYPITSLSTGVWGTTGKTPTDHALSNVTNSDCVSSRLVDGEEVCQPIKPKEPPPIEDRSLIHSKK